MAQILDMPRLSDTMKEGVLRKWHKKEGDRVSPGDVLAEVETDKATMDFESFDEGVLLKRLIGDGETVPVGSPIAILGNAGEDIASAVSAAQGRMGAAAGPAPTAAATRTAPLVAPPAPPAPAAPKAAAPAPAPDRGERERPLTPSQRAARREQEPPETTRPAAGNGRPSGADGRRGLSEIAPAAPAGRPAEARGGVIASPLARKLATDLGVDLRTLRGSGPGGRVVERDVRAAGEAHEAEPFGARAAVEARPPSGQPAVPTVGGPGGAGPAPALPSHIFPDRRSEPRPSPRDPTGDSEVPLNLMRKTIARRTLEAKVTIPHFYLEADVDMEPAMLFRDQVSEIHGARLSVNDLVLKAAALALRRVPEANATFTGESIVRFGRVDIGVAVAIDDGLVTPVLRAADVKTLGQISTESRDLVERARNRKLRPEDMVGSTFSVSNLGMFGIKAFAAIINPPEAAILAVGQVRKEPVVKDDRVVIGQRMSLTLSCDHRALDGATGARLLAAIVTILERPMSLAF